MSEAPETPAPPARTRTPLLRGLTAKPWFAITASVVALALVATGAVVAISRFGNPFASTTSVGSAPTAFPVALMATDSPMTDRGETVPVLVQAESPDKIAAAELWEDDRLVLRVADPENAGGDGHYSISLALDHVPTTAGEHQLTTRLVTTSGHVGLSLPLDLATLDLPEDLGHPVHIAEGVLAPEPVTELHSVPGDTLTTIAGRLAVPVDRLISTISVGGPGDVMPPGTRVLAPVAPRDVAKNPQSYTLPDSTWLDTISIKVDACDAVVTSLKDEAQFLYGGPGYLPIGEVPAKGEVRLSGLPIGVSEIVAYVGGAKSDVSGANAPSPPTKVVIPEECAQSGWTGNASIINDVLVSPVDVPRPYLYVAFERGNWQRFPAGADDYLPLSQTADLRSFAAFAGHNQIDVQLWSVADDGSAGLAASGLFCRASMKNPDPKNGSTADGPCRPLKDVPGLGSGLDPVPANGTITLSARTAPPALYSPVWLNGTGPAYPISQEVVVNPGVSEITLDVNVDTPSVSGTTVVQFTYTPVGPSSPTTKPPGLFHTIKVNSNHASVTFDPRKFANLQVDADEGGGVNLQDELAHSLATAQLLADDNLLTRFYVRAIYTSSTSSTTSTTAFSNLASSSVQFDTGVPNDGSSVKPQLVNPTFTVTPGLQQSATVHAMNGRCLTVQQYPAAGVYASNPWAGPRSSPNGQLYPNGYTGTKNSNGQPGWSHYGQPSGGEKLITAGSPGLSDLDIAKSTWKVADWVYCDEPEGPVLRNAIAKMEAAYINRDKPDCGLVCVLKSVVMGAVIGFMVGGPYGAIVGAAVGLAVGLASVLSPGLYEALKQLWDAVATLYNKIYSFALDIFDYLNPACRLAGAADPDIGAACDAMSHIAVAIVVTSVTGLPPQLPVSDVIESLADGNLEHLIEAGIRIAMENLVSCDDLKLSGESATAAKAAATSYGDNDVNATLASSTDANGDLSACTAVAAIIAQQVRSALVEKNGEWVGAGYGMGPVPGLVMRPYADTSPVLTVSGGIPDATMKNGATCPATMNMEVSLNEQVYTLKPVPFTLVVRHAKPWEKPDGVADTWSASVPIPVMPNWGHGEGNSWTPFPLANVVKTRSATANDRYLRLGVESPCIDAHYQLDMDYLTGANPVFTQGKYDASAWYLLGYGLTWTPSMGSHQWF